jgi:hypothetical protein
LAVKCLVEDCQKSKHAKGYCSMHWTRLQRHGSLDDPTPTLETRFWKFVDMSDPDHCWLWKGSHNHRGYGLFQDFKVRRTGHAHRWAYELAIGPIPTGLEIDHLCFNRGCVNPFHLEAVTHRENIRRGLLGPNGPRQRITACRQGHLYDDANTWYDKSGKRHCRECNRLNASRYYHEHKSLAARARTQTGS